MVFHSIAPTTVIDTPANPQIDFNSGHGVNDSDQKYNEEMADIFSFAFWQTDHPDYQSITK